MHLKALSEGLSLGLAYALLWISQLAHRALQGVIIFLQGYACPQELACLKGHMGLNIDSIHGTLNGAVHGLVDAQQLQACVYLLLSCTRDFMCISAALCHVYGSHVNLFSSQGTKVCM